LFVSLCAGLYGMGGCDDAPAPSPPAAPPAPVKGGRLFDPARAGEIRGEVLWRGPRPAVGPFRSIPEPLTDQPPPPPREWPNPNEPVIEAKTGGMAGALVWLKDIDVEVSRPWDLPKVRVELRDQQFHVIQGKREGRIGFVRAGDGVELVSRDGVFHSVQARGLTFFTRNGRANAFFTCTLPEPDQVRARRLEFPEIVELSSGCGYFWMRAYLLVSPHPHVALTDGRGRFTLPGVPPGEYEVVAWHPSWRVARTERNPDNARVQQVRFEPPLESRKGVRVEPGRTASVEFGLGR
jgi:hypothetical protein